MVYFYWATPTGEAQFKIRSFIGVRNGIQLYSHGTFVTLYNFIAFIVISLRCATIIEFNWKWRNTSQLHVFSAVSWSAWFFGRGKSICIKFACLSYHSFRRFYMVDGGKSCFRSSEREVVSTPVHCEPIFTQQSSPRSSHGPLRKTNLFWAFLRRKYRIDLCSHINLLPI